MEEARLTRRSSRPASRAVRRRSSELPQPRVVRARRWNVSLVWLVPFVAVAIAASMLVRSIFLTGPRIEIQFKSADGVEAGKTEVRYKEVVIGKVVSVALRDDRQSVGVVVQLDRSAASFAVEDTTFWVVGRASAPAASAAWARCSRAPTSAPTPASRTSRAASSSASRRRLSCCAASPGRSSSCARRTSARSTSARRCSIAARRSAASSATRSTPSATSCR
jgi:hypothetical protein